MSQGEPELNVTRVGKLVCRSINSAAQKTTQRPRPTLVWVHGLGESGLCFERLLVAPELSSFNHLAPDLVGYGRSTWDGTDQPHSLGDHAQTVHQLIREETRGPVVLVGHSMGGVIGQLLCENLKPGDATADRLAAFVNIEGNLSLGDCGYSSKAEPQSLRDFVNGGMHQLASEIYEIGVSDAAHRTYFASCCLARAETFHLNSVELVALSKQEHLAQRFAKLELAKAFLQGNPDGAPPRSAQLLRECGEEPVIFKPAGHWPFIDQRQRFLLWLGQFLAQLDLAPGE